jgi:hypothetical protein
VRLITAMIKPFRPDEVVALEHGSAQYPAALPFGGEQPAELHAGEVSRGRRHLGAFELSGQGLASSPGQRGIDVAHPGPFVVE